MPGCSSHCSDEVVNGCSSMAKLHLLTYLYPSLPIELYQTYQRYLEEILDCDAYLSVESRWSAPPRGTVDPFTTNDVDIGFMCSTGYVRLFDEQNKWMELLPVAPVHNHPKVERQPVYFSEVIVRKNEAAKYKGFVDLRGCRWASNDVESLSGNVSMLSECKRLGFTASFFGKVLQSGSHLESINLVLNNLADTAAIDSNVLQRWLEQNPETADQLHVLCSLGPWPIQPIVVNSRLPAEVKSKIAAALLNVGDNVEYSKRFLEYGVKGFQSVEPAFYDRTRQAMELLKHEQSNRPTCCC